MTQRAILIFFSVLLLVGCASRMPMANTLTEGTETTAEETEELGVGRTVAITQCNACHRTFWPDEFSPRQWKPITKKMGNRAFLSRGETSALNAYMALASRHVRAEGK